MYEYKDHKNWPCSAEGQKQFLDIRDRVHQAIKDSGCISMGKAISGESGDSFRIQACVDRLVELGEIKEAKNPISSAGQHRIFIPASY